MQSTIETELTDTPQISIESLPPVQEYALSDDEISHRCIPTSGSLLMNHIEY